MALTRAFLDWAPQVNIKIDPLQASFKFPLELLPLARVILYRRYVDAVGQSAEFNVEWVEQYTDENATPTRVDVPLEELQPLPPSYAQSRIQVFHMNKTDEAKLLITVTIYKTGTVLVQGVKCQQWLGIEFDSLIYVVRAIYGLLQKGADRDTVNTALSDDMGRIPMPIITYRAKGDVTVSATTTQRKTLATTQLVLRHEEGYSALLEGQNDKQTLPLSEQSPLSPPSDKVLPSINSAPLESDQANSSSSTSGSDTLSPPTPTPAADTVINSHDSPESPSSPASPPLASDTTTAETTLSTAPTIDTMGPNYEK